MLVHQRVIDFHLEIKLRNNGARLCETDITKVSQWDAMGYNGIDSIDQPAKLQDITWLIGWLVDITNSYKITIGWLTPSMTHGKFTISRSINWIETNPD